MGLFTKKKYINPKEYTTEGSLGMVYLLDSVVSSQRLQNELCHYLTHGAQSYKTMKQLSYSAYHTIASYNNNANKCLEKCKNTADPDTFFKYWKEAMQWYEYIAYIEKYVYNGIMPSNISIYKAQKRKQIEIRHLIDRAYKKAAEKAQKLKTEKATHKCFISAYENLVKYRSEFDQASEEKLTKKFAKHLKESEC